MNIFITGITGTLGSALAQYHYIKGDRVSGCSRNEEKVALFQKEYPWVKLHLGDCAALAQPHTRMNIALQRTDRCYHLAAHKHVDLCQANPCEAVSNNLLTLEWVLSACQQEGASCIFVSSDKACLPNGVYGATKLIGEALALQYGAGVVRLGNLIASSGSVFKYWDNLLSRGLPLTVNHPEMTRFFIPVKQAATFVAEKVCANTVTAPVMLAASLLEVARTLAPDHTHLGKPRPGETVHQWLIGPDEPYTQEDGTILLHKGTQPPEDSITTSVGLGISSREAGRWNIVSLLLEAGLEKYA